MPRPIDQPIYITPETPEQRSFWEELRESICDEEPLRQPDYYWVADFPDSPRMYSRADERAEPVNIPIRRVERRRPTSLDELVGYAESDIDFQRRLNQAALTSLRNDEEINWRGPNLCEEVVLPRADSNNGFWFSPVDAEELIRQATVEPVDFFGREPRPYYSWNQDVEISRLIHREEDVPRRRNGHDIFNVQDLVLVRGKAKPYVIYKRGDDEEFFVLLPYQGQCYQSAVTRQLRDGNLDMKDSLIIFHKERQVKKSFMRKMTGSEKMHFDYYNTVPNF